MGVINWRQQLEHLGSKNLKVLERKTITMIYFFKSVSIKELIIMMNSDLQTFLMMRDFAIVGP